MKLGQFSKGGRPTRGRAPAARRGFSAPRPVTVAPAAASRPGTYGGPPGSFITRGACPPGYSRISMPRGPSQPQEYRCIPRVAAARPAPAPMPVAPPPPPAPTVTVSPAIEVSPAIQTQISPQISPVMTMQQASPGAAVQASPVQASAPAQVAPGPVADPAIPEPAPTGYPAMAPSAPAEPYAPEPAGPMIPAAWPSSPELERAIAAEQDRGIPWLPIAAAAAVGLFLFTRQPKKGK